jgi:hypothetical protein
MGQSFLQVTSANQLIGGQVHAAGDLVPCDPTVRDQHVAAGVGVALDKAAADVATAGHAKTACALLTFTGATPITLDLSNLAAATGVQVAGANAFSAWNRILFNNLGNQPIAVSPGGTNPLRTKLGGTSPVHTLQPGDLDHWYASAGLAVDATHKTITFTPTSGGQLAVAIGGS